MTPWAFDTETFLIQPGQMAPVPVCLQWSLDGKTSELRHLNPEIDKSGWEEIHSRIMGDSLLVGHNTAFDLAVICAEVPDFIGPVFRAFQAGRVRDTLTRQLLLDIAQGVDDETGFIAVLGRRQKVAYDLGTTAERWAPMALDKSDPWRLKYGTLWDIPVLDWPVEAVRYAERDALATATAYLGQEGLAPLLVDQERQARAAWWIHLMGSWGLRTDRATVVEAERGVLEEIERDRGILLGTGLLRADGSKDTKEARVRMVRAFEALGEPPHPTEAGLKVLGARTAEEVDPGTLQAYLVGTPAHISLDEDSCIASGDEILGAYTRFSSASTLLKKVRRLYKGCGDTPLQPSFYPLKATGRTSCRQSIKERAGDKTAPPTWGAQVQNPPTMGLVRESFIPRPGFMYADSDYSGMELCSWSQCCKWAVGFSQMAEALNNDKDPHTLFAASLLEQPAPFIAESRKGLHGPEWKQKAEAGRQVGKISNFGWPGGMGPARFRLQARTQYGVNMTLEEAKKYKRIWSETWPEAVEWFRFINSLIGTDGKATVPHFLSQRIRGGIPYTVSCNTLFQGLAADAAKAAGFEISRECYSVPESDLFGSRIVNFVHDQFLTEVPEWKASRAALRMNALMISEAQKWMPDVKIKTEPALVRRWYKGASPVWGANGELLEWTPKGN